MSDARLPFDEPGAPGAAQPPALESRLDARDREGRARAVDPRHNVALEASAGTGKTTVLVSRYVNLLDHGVDPANILAMTFTRKAAAEMRERIVARLHEKAAAGEIPAARWRHLRDRLGEVAISTIDAFCLSLLREFPLEADLDPGFSMADETEVPRLIDESLDRALQVCRHLARDDEDVALVFAHLGDRRVRAGLATLLDRRIVAPQVLARYLETAPPALNVAAVAARAARGLLDVFEACQGGLDAFVESGPPAPAFVLLARDLRRLRELAGGGDAPDAAWLQAVLTRAGDHLLTQQGEPRRQLPYLKAEFASEHEYQTHKALVQEAGPRFEHLLAAHRRDLNMLAARGLRRMFAVASTEYRRTLDAHAALDFADVLLRALDLLRQMEEFAQSRYRLEARYQHVLVDEFQDTSRAQWELVRLLVQAWGEGLGLSAEGPLLPSIFIVGDRKQSIYGFREADVSILREAGSHLGTLRGGGEVRRSISRSFRSVAPLLAFVNDACADMDKAPDRPDAFAYDEQDRFPLAPPDGADAARGAAPVEAAALGLVVEEGPEACADAVAAEIARLVGEGVEIRDRNTGVPRPVRPGDISVLFRTREAHRELERALERRGLPVYVYKGLGFYDADEVKDVLAILRYLADPFSDLRAAALARSRLVRLSDEGLRRLAPRIAQALRGSDPVEGLDDADAEALARARPALARWRGLVDRIPPADLLDRVLADSGYATELAGPRVRQARENLKKIRGLVRRVENRGYATLARIAAHLDRLSVGEEPNAVIDALDAVNLMTVHAAKGLEFPVVFVVNLNRGTGGRPAPVRISTEAGVPGVGVGSFQTDADEDRAAREREETKRLVYVAMTRARDRLYLGAVRKDGGLVAGRGSLAEVLPATLVDVIRDGGDAWTARSGATHRFHIVRPGGRAAAPSLHTESVARGLQAARPDEDDTRGARLQPGEPGRDDLDRTPLPDAPPPTTVTALIAPAAGAPPPGTGTASSQLAGTLVHRLLEHVGAAAPGDAAAIMAAARRLLAPDEAGAPDDAAEVLARAAELYTRIRHQPDVARLYATGERFHEVPFSREVGGRVVRGAIDCLVREGERVTILEFKTGRRRAAHDEQIALYRQAVEHLFPGAAIEARIVYPDGTS